MGPCHSRRQCGVWLSWSQSWLVIRTNTFRWKTNRSGLELALGQPGDSLAPVSRVSQNHSKPRLHILDCFSPSCCESLGQLWPLICRGWPWHGGDVVTRDIGNTSEGSNTVIMNDVNQCFIALFLPRNCYLLRKQDHTRNLIVGPMF